MLPTLQQGDHVLVRPGGALVEPGAVVLVQHPHRTDQRLVKRVEHITSDGALFVVGDNPKASTDSRAFGVVPRGNVLGVVVGRLN